MDVDRVAADLKRSGADEAQVNKYKDYVQKVRKDPTAAADVARDPEVQQAGREIMNRTRQATWWALGGVILSMITVILGSLTGSGELLQPVPILGVRRPARDPRG